MKRTTPLRWVVGAGLAIAVSAGSGCTHNYYYGTSAGCPPMVGSTVSTQVGQVCDVPSAVTAPAPIVSGTVAPGSGVVVTPNSQRVVTSLPTSRPIIGGNRLGGGWRAPAPESMARTSVDGALDAPR